MSFHQQNFSARFGAMGDEAEAIYQQVLPVGKSIEFGWRRPPVTMRNMTNKIKNMPDFYAGAGYLVEAMGCGRDEILKLKTNKWQALQEWNEDQPLLLFAWNSALKEWLLLDFKGLDAAVELAGRVKQFHDGPTYYPIGWGILRELSVRGGKVADEE